MNAHFNITEKNKMPFYRQERDSAGKTTSQIQGGGESALQFVDNRIESVAQMRLQEMNNNSPQAESAAQLKTMADNYSDKQPKPIQKQANPKDVKKENNTGLPDNLKTGMENLSGISLDDVKVHRNSDKPSQLQAHAYAQGTDIHLASGQEKHLPHEAWHVVQQKQGRVKPTMQMKGKVNVNDDASLETEADQMGTKALQMKVPDVGSPKVIEIQGDVAQRIGLGALAVGVGVVGGLVGLYQYLKKQKDRQSRDAAYQGILDEQAGQPIAGGVQHTTHIPGGRMPFSHTVASPGTGNSPQRDRTYNVEVNNDDPVGLGRNDPELIRTAEIHERTHVSVDQRYSANSDSSRQLLGHGLEGPELGDHLNEQWERRDNRLTMLQAIVDRDNYLNDRERSDITQRIGNARMMIEYDPTINELLAYTHEYDMNPSGPSVKALVALANESRVNRTIVGSQLVGDWPT